MNRLRMAFAVSVILNLFLVGALCAGLVSLRGGGGGMINAGALRVAGAELPQAERRPFRVALRQTRRAMRPTIARGRAAQAEAAALLRRPEVDEAAVNAALGRTRMADIAVRAAVEQRAVSYAATLPVQDRAKLADAMERRAEKGAAAR